VRSKTNRGSTTQRAARKAAILIVEDGASLRAVLCELVQRAFPRYAVHEAANCAQALEKADAFRLRLMIVDIRLPDGDGIELATRIRATQPHTGVIVMSSQDSAVFVERSLAAGARAFIGKDRLPRELIPAMKSVLAVRRRSKDSGRT
jgi:DNA-binding NarL/FixJ family response regulator